MTNSFDRISAIILIFTSFISIHNTDYCKSCFFHSESGDLEPMNPINYSKIKYPVNLSSRTYTLNVSIAVSSGSSDGYWCTVLSDNKTRAFPCDLGIKKTNQPYCAFDAVGEKCSGRCEDRRSNKSFHFCKSFIDCTFSDPKTTRDKLCNIKNDKNQSFCHLELDQSVRTLLQCNEVENNTFAITTEEKCQFPYEEDGTIYDTCRIRKNNLFTTCPLINIKNKFHNFFRYCSYTKYTNPNCIFPFYYNGTVYNECTDVDMDVYWCSPTKRFFKFFYACENVPRKYNRRCLYPFLNPNSENSMEHYSCSDSYRTWQNITWCSAQYEISNKFYYCENTDYSHVDCAFPFNAGGGMTSYYCVRNNKAEEERICPVGGEQNLTLSNAIHCASMKSHHPICRPDLK